MTAQDQPLWSPCDSGGCVQTATDNGYVLVRSSQRPDEVARFTEEEWAAFVESLRGETIAGLERPGSMLCDCANPESPPSNPRTRKPIDHHCDCSAVEAAATLLGAYSKTTHARQCEHGGEFDVFYVLEPNHA